MSYDTKCYDLAEAFLSEFADGTPAPSATIAKHAPRLAQAIQDTIEQELADIDAYNVMRERHPDEDDGQSYADPRDESDDRLSRE
jgi:hypothetical protein